MCLKEGFDGESVKSAIRRWAIAKRIFTEERRHAHRSGLSLGGGVREVGGVDILSAYGTAGADNVLSDRAGNKSQSYLYDPNQSSFSVQSTVFECYPCSSYSLYMPSSPPSPSSYLV